MTGKKNKARVRQVNQFLPGTTMSSEAWWCLEHGCWNSTKRRLCLCERPKEQ